MTAFNWDSTIENDGGDFKLLEPGVYPFTVKSLEKGYFNGSSSVPACPKAQLTLRVGTGMNAADVTDGLLLDDSLEWKLCQFFTAIGDRKHGQPLRMNWDAVRGKGGWLEIEHRSYTSTKDGTEKTANNVARYLDPADMQDLQAAPTPAQQAPVAQQAPAPASAW